ncbi:hypothetical protein BwSF12_54910 [Bradyrhizobium ottawaense]|uniref:hypothetical protein n=1 Tax=Bradyrhizobium ottawaense TaxID=931866 RepID=UPI0027D54714|nr:hypothetical protein BwSF12_54910 [Bradyrhizobium ottawaense]GMO94031.1 hypothetical protein BwSF19_74160 [Bradyrhizobium ottawaense]
MRFELPEGAGSFDIPDDWWRFAEMERFQPSPGGYYPYKLRPQNDVEIVSIAEVEPPRRNPGVPMLKKFKMMPVLFAFQSPECALPPVEVYCATSGPYRFTVHNGFHRFYGSMAAGYTHLPVLVCEPFDP